VSRGCAADLIRTIGTIVDSVALAENVGAMHIVCTPELEFVNEWRVAFLLMQYCRSAPCGVASEFIRAIVTVIDLIAAALCKHALIAAQALEGVPVHLASIEVTMVRLALSVPNVVWVNNEIWGIARNAHLGWGTTRPAKC